MIKQNVENIHKTRENMKAKLIESIISDELNNTHKTYGVCVLNKCYYDLSLNKELVERFVDFLNNEEVSEIDIDVIVEDFLS